MLASENFLIAASMAAFVVVLSHVIYLTVVLPPAPPELPLSPPQAASAVVNSTRKIRPIFALSFILLSLH
jgi:hypothetical protein